MVVLQVIVKQEVGEADHRLRVGLLEVDLVENFVNEVGKLVAGQFRSQLGDEVSVEIGNLSHVHVHVERKPEQDLLEQKQR